MKKFLALLLICVSVVLPMRADEPRDINYAELGQLIATSDVPVVVDCYATWCGPCRKFSPIFDQVGVETGSRAKFFRLDVDGSPEILKLGVNAVPTILVFYIKEGKLNIETNEGALDKVDFQAFLSRALKMADGSKLKQVSKD